MRNFKLYALATGATFLLNVPIFAIAQTTLEVPPPTQQNQPNFAQPPPPPVYDLPRPREGETIQLLPPELFMPQRQSPPQSTPRPFPAEPPPNIVAPMNQGPALPEVFRGCWQGLVSNVDWIRKEPGGHKVGYWTPKTYRFCYKRLGNGPFKMTFTETGIAPNDQLFNVRGAVVPLSTDGHAFATLRATLHFDEYSVGRDATAPSFSVDEVTHLDCKINGDLMTVSADVHGTRDGDPWFRAHWRADFRHFPD